jgi:hypothetical protein
MAYASCIVPIKGTKRDAVFATDTAVVKAADSNLMLCFGSTLWASLVASKYLPNMLTQAFWRMFEAWKAAQFAAGDQTAPGVAMFPGTLTGGDILDADSMFIDVHGYTLTQSIVANLNVNGIAFSVGDEFLITGTDTRTYNQESLTVGNLLRSALDAVREYLT